jgi:hypothetical protein
MRIFQPELPTGLRGSVIKLTLFEKFLPLRHFSVAFVCQLTDSDFFSMFDKRRSWVKSSIEESSQAEWERFLTAGSGPAPDCGLFPN